jgi:hypothetical protein
MMEENFGVSGKIYPRWIEMTMCWTCTRHVCVPRNQIFVILKNIKMASEFNMALIEIMFVSSECCSLAETEMKCKLEIFA